MAFRGGLFLLAALALLVTPLGTAEAGVCEPPVARRAALVIGNNAYERGNKPERAAASARAVGEAMAKIGFDVTTATDVGRADMLKAVEALAGKLRKGDAAFVFFAGRGVNFAGIDYLLPVDASISSGDEIKQGGVKIDEIVEALHRKGTGCIVLVVDASRADPVKEAAAAEAAAAAAAAAAAKAALPKGAKAPKVVAKPASIRTITPDRVLTPRGLTLTGGWRDTLAVFSAGLNQRALEKTSPADNDPHSLFTRTLLTIVGKQGQSHQDTFFELRDTVASLAIKANVAQTPAYYDTLRGSFLFAPVAK
jgi:hypothetical protein